MGGIVIADATTGQIRRTLVEPPKAEEELSFAFPPSVSRSADGATVYYTTPGNSRCSAYVTDAIVLPRVWRVLVSGGSPEPVAEADHVAVAPDGSRFATSCENRVTIHDVDSGASTVIDITRSSEVGVRDLTWSPDGATVLVGAGGPEAPTEIFVVDADVGSARRLGPPEDAVDGTGWNFAEVRASDGLIGVVQDCCSLDANSYDGGRFFAVVDPDSGEVIDTLDTPDFGIVEYDATGGHQLLLVRAQENVPAMLSRRDGVGPFIEIERAPQFIAIDW